MSGLSFTGKVVLVTGACSSVGSELAKYFSKLGASLVLTDRDKYHLNKVGDECSGNPVLKIAADLTKNEDVTSVIKQALTEFKKIDVLVNYVGPVESPKTDDQTSLDAFKFMLNVSVSSVYWITQLAYPHLAKTRGNVVNVNGLRPLSASNLTSCSVSRSALDELTRSLASQFLCKGVRVNAVAAGPVENRSDDSAKPAEKSAGLRAHLSPEDIAAAVVFLASDLAHFIFGANIPVDGGEHLTNVNEVPDNSLEKHQVKTGNATVRSTLPKSDPAQPDSHKKEESHVDGSIDEHAKKSEQKNEQAKQPSARHDARKAEAEKSINVKHQNSEKMSISKPVSKNNNN